MDQRDRNLTIARGLRRGLVATGIIGSVGFAAVAAVSTGPTSPTAGGSGTAHVGATGRGAGLLRGLTGDDGGRERSGDDGRPARHLRPRPPSAPLPGPSLQLGSGSPQVETLAHVALVARFGPGWFPSVGTPEQPGTFLATVSGDVEAPGVHEVEYGAPLPELIAAAGGATSGVQAVLIGGFHGAWVPGPSVPSTTMSAASLAPHGASVGAGVVLVLGNDRCGLRESAGIASYLAEQSAGQCGPCFFGLPMLAEALARLAHHGGTSAVDGAVDVVVRMTTLVRGRGACKHPDGTARFSISTLRAFSDDIAAHLGGGCRAAAAH